MHGGRDAWSRGENSLRRRFKVGECSIQGRNLTPSVKYLIYGGRDAWSGREGMLIPSRSNTWSEDAFRVQEEEDAWSKRENSVQDGKLGPRGRGACSEEECWLHCNAAQSRGMLGCALTSPGALLPRDHPALCLLLRLLPALRGAVHVVGLSPPWQPPGLQCPLRARGHLQRLPPAVPLCLPDPLRPGALPTPQPLGTVSLGGGSCAWCPWGVG